VRPARRHPLAFAAVLAGVALALPAAASAEAAWRLEQPAPPSGARFKVPLGRPGDLQFLGPNRGLLAIEGNATVSRGLFFYDGRGWRPLSTVCGAAGDSARIAWAGPDEFWMVSEPSLPRQGAGLGLCHFKDGQVVGSYSTAPESPDPYRPMDAIACNGPNDCWFGGVGSQDPSGQRAGAFHLHWDGTTLTSLYAPQGRGVSDLEFFQGTLFETVFAGVQREDPDTKVELGQPEQVPYLIHKLVAGAFHNEPFAPLPRPDVPSQGTEMLGMDADDSDLWFVGGGAASGPDVPEDGSVVPRPPIAVHLVPPFYQQVAIDESQFGPTERFVDVAAVPGTSTAWVASQPFADRASVTAKARVARLGADGSTEVFRVPSSGSGRGSAARIAFSGPNEGWVATSAGWLFHYTDGTQYPQNDDSAFASLITFRPNEAAAQAVPDTPPADDSQLFAPPPVEIVNTATTTQTTQSAALPALMKNVKVSRKKLTIAVRFQLVRRARVQLIAKRKTKVVAKTKQATLKPGRHTLTLKLTRKRWPTALRFNTRELDPGVPQSTGTGTGTTTATTGGDTVTTRAARGAGR